MSKNSVVSLTLQLKGQQVSQELKRISVDQIAAVQKINTEQRKLISTQTLQKREALALNATRQLGIRTEQQIHAEIKKTHATYAQLSVLQRQGVVSAKDMERAYAAMKTRVSALNTELGKTVSAEKQIQQIQKTNGVGGGATTLQRGAIVAGAVAGAGYMLQQPVKRTVDYDKDLHYAAQKLSDSPEDWKVTKKWMNEVIVKNAVSGGVTRDDSFIAMDQLIADGAYAADDIGKVKQNLVKAHFEATKSALASGGEITDFANVGLAARKRGLDEAKVQAMVIKADDLGSMSAKDMAKALPSQLGKLPVDQVNGERQVAQLIALNEIAMRTAGNAAEASNNVNNFLGKMNSSDTIQRLQKEHKIDLPKRYAEGKEVGKTDFDVFGEVVDEIIAKDKNSQSLVDKIKNTKNDSEKKKLLETQQAIFEQSNLAAILPDMQALMTLVARQRYGGDWEDTTNIALTKGAETRDLKYNYNKEYLAAYGINAADVTRKNAEYQTLESTIGVLGDMGTEMAKLTEQYPILTDVIGATELALKALTVAAGGAALLQFGGKTDLPGAGTMTTKGKPQVKGAGSVKGTAGLAGLAYAGYELFQPIDDLIYGALDKIRGGTGERPDFVQQAIEKSIEQQAQQSNELLTQQQEANKLSADLSNKLSTLINVTQQNKPIPFSASSLLDSVSSQTKAESSRTGAFIPFRVNN